MAYYVMMGILLLLGIIGIIFAVKQNKHLPKKV